jgi:hypothetical protein
MRDRSDRYQVQNQVQSMPVSAKKIGGYLVEAGLLTTAQISVALNDQQSTGMRFGEIVVARGWLKEQTVEWIMDKVVEPEREALIRRQQTASQPGASRQASRWSNQGAYPLSQPSAMPAKQTNPLQSVPPTDRRTAPLRAMRPTVDPTAPPVAQPDQTANKATSQTNPKYIRREVPISKPLPSVNSSDGDVNWVG